MKIFFAMSFKASTIFVALQNPLLALCPNVEEAKLDYTSPWITLPDSTCRITMANFKGYQLSFTP